MNVRKIDAIFVVILNVLTLFILCVYFRDAFFCVFCLPMARTSKAWFTMQIRFDLNFLFAGSELSKCCSYFS